MCSKYRFAFSVFVLISISYSNAIAQFNYIDLIAKGSIPTDIIKSTHQKVLDDIDNQVGSEDSKNDQKVKSDFLLKSNYMLDELLSSGKVVYGNEINDMINLVGNNLLPDSNQSKIRFYVLKSNTVNAFSTNQGMIFITTGLLARLSTEAELAFVLAHEIAHYTEKHVINSVLESDRVFSKRKRLKYDNYDENILKLSKYSKKLEFEADSIGFVNYVNAGYNLDGAKQVFNVLKYSSLPMENQSIDVASIHSGIPSKKILDTVVEIDVTEKSDLLSSHPNISSRIEKIEEANINTRGKFHKLLSQNEFNLLVNSCKVEEIKLQFQNLNYVTALYNSMCLIKTYPEHPLLKEFISKSLYSISKYANAKQLNNLNGSYKDHPGEISKLYYLFESISNEQITALSIDYIDKITANKENDFSKSLLSDLFYELTYYHKKDLSYFGFNDQIHKDSLNVCFHRKFIKTPSQTLLEIAQVEIEKANELLAKDKEYYDFLQSMNYDKRMKYLSKVNKKESKKDLFRTGKISAEKIVYVDPNYSTIDERKGVKLVKSEFGDEVFIEQIFTAGRAAELDVAVLSPKTLEVDDIDKYNDIATLNAGFSELLKHSSNGMYHDVFVLSLQNELKEIRNKYGTDFFSYNGQIVYKKHKKYKIPVLVGSMLFFVALPLGIKYAFTPDYETYYYNMVLDLKNGKFVTANFDRYDLKSSYGRTCSLLYNDMYTLKSSVDEK